jgi:hypothetical protein
MGMTASVTERLDMLVADGLAYETALIALAKRLSADERKAALEECREIIDALMADPKTNPRGHSAFQHADKTLKLIFG